MIAFVLAVAAAAISANVLATTSHSGLAAVNAVLFVAGIILALYALTR